MHLHYTYFLVGVHSVNMSLLIQRAGVLYITLVSSEIKDKKIFMWQPKLNNLMPK